RSSGRGARRLQLLSLPAQILQLLLERDHLQLAADDDFLELLEIEDLLLELRLRALEVAHDLLVRAHVAEDSDRADHVALRVAQGGGVQRRRDDLAGGAARVEDGVPGDAALDHLTERRRELARLLGADEARQRLLDDLVLAEAEQLRDGVDRLDRISIEVSDENGGGLLTVSAMGEG